MNRELLRAWIERLAHKSGIDLDAPQSRYTIWFYDGIRPWFVGVSEELSGAIKIGRKFHRGSTSGIYVLVCKTGDLRTLDELPER